MEIFGLSITRRPKATPDMVTRLPTAGNGWLASVQESFAGAWQRNVTVNPAQVLSYSTVWACVTLIASDVGKIAVELVELEKGIWVTTENPAYSPVLRRPNRYQNRIKFFENWIISKLTRGNTYVLKERDGRGVVVALYILDPSRVSVLVAQDGAHYYKLSVDYLAGLTMDVTVPASEIIHDVGVALYHPLVGLSPLHACGLAAMKGIKIEEQSSKFFANNSNPGGVLTAPASISNETAERIQKHWDANYAGQQNVGRVAVLGDGLKYVPMAMTAVNSQLVDQLKLTDEKICSTFHVPSYMVGVGKPPNYNNIEALNQQYYSQCLQNLIECIELCLDEGLRLPATLGVSFDLDGLLRMDSATKMDFITKGVKGSIYSPNEARKRFNLPPAPGGDSPMSQQQNYSLDALARRDAAAPAPDSNRPEPPPASGHGDDEDLDLDKGLIVALEAAKAAMDFSDHHHMRVTL